MTQSTGLSVRQHERERINLPVQFTVASDHRAQVRFAPKSNVTNKHMITGIAIDLSRGGLGMECGLFLPRMCEGTIRIFDTSFADATPEELLQAEPTIEYKVKVRRANLERHDPAYVIGLAFMSPTEELQSKVDTLCQSFYTPEADRDHE